MRSVAVIPACAVIAGVAAGILLSRPVTYAPLALTLWAAAVAAYVAHRERVTVVCVTLGYAVSGMALGAHAACKALAPSIRMVLDREVGGFALTSLGPAGVHEPLTIRAHLDEDAVSRAGGSDGRADVISVRVQIESIWIRGIRHDVRGGLRLSIAGGAAAGRVGSWRAGRVIDVPVTFRRPMRYLNDGVSDFERDLALDGMALHASTKSALLVDVVSDGSAFDEAAADVRALVRERVAQWVGIQDALAAGIVTAILIGDRTGLPDEIRLRLQAAGTYHVIAISGGNIAILAALMAGVLLLAGGGGRVSTVAIIAGVVSYAAVVSAGPSVWRATATAVAYLAARVIDHRSPPWNAMAVSAALLAAVAPLDVRDAGFALTFGATAAIIEAARRQRRPGHDAPLHSVALSWLVASVAASAAAEVVLLPIAASVFSRVTAAGLLLNIVAVPLMTLAQIAGLVVVACGGVEWIAVAAGAVAAWAAAMLVETARLVDVLPWLTMRVPAPSLFVVVLYYAALGAAVWLRVPESRSRLAASNPRVSAAAIAAVCAIAILVGASPRVRAWRPDGRLVLTAFDVGQGEAILLQTPGARTLMIDAGGAGFDGTAFDIGGRVLAPALWARGVRRLDLLALTHGDPDHIGGAAALVRDLDPREMWEGIVVPRHEPQRALRDLAVHQGIPVTQQLPGATVRLDQVQIRVLHPPAPGWERQRVRNDDSLVLEVLYGNVAILLTGDIGTDIERAILPKLTLARMRILKVAHHGSRTSTSQQLLDGWKPQIALISCGRGNRFGHPVREVIGRLEEAGVDVYRTDTDGQITIASDGQSISVDTFVRR